MAEFASSETETTVIYKLMIGGIVPRPIAWVSTVGADGVSNLAPFSFFNGVSHNPPTVAFSVIDRDGELKDTSRNIEAHAEFIVHIVNESLSERMNITCGDYGAHIDEFAEAGLTPVPGTVVGVPRIVEAQVAMECRVSHLSRIGNPPTTSHILGEVLYWHIADEVLTEKGRVDANALRAVGRMGGVEYTKTQDRFAIERPVIPAKDPRSIATYRAGMAKAPLPPN